MHSQENPQIQATKHVVDFVCEEDRAGRLFVVYYAGHGRAGSQGQLLLSGSLTRDGEPAGENASIDWTDVESALKTTKADVLVVFDCCCAGLLLCRPPEARGRCHSKRKFLYVAACRAEQRTASAGPQSFNSAMIRALGLLAADQFGFTVRRLVRTLMSYESFPRDNQEAVVFESRFGAVGGDIWLVPLPGKGNAAASGCSRVKGVRVESTRSTADVLDFRFHFAERVTDAEVEDMTLALKRFLRAEKGLRCHRVSFLKHKSHVEVLAGHWLGLIRRGKS